MEKGPWQQGGGGFVGQGSKTLGRETSKAGMGSCGSLTKTSTSISDRATSNDEGTRDISTATHCIGSTTALRCYAVATRCSHDVVGQKADHDTVSPRLLLDALVIEPPSRASFNPQSMGWRRRWNELFCPQRAARQMQILRGAAFWGSIHPNDPYHPKTPTRQAPMQLSTGASALTLLTTNLCERLEAPLSLS